MKTIGFRKLAFTVSAVLVTFTLSAQHGELSGYFTDSANEEPIFGAVVVLSNISDADFYMVSMSGEDGGFLFSSLPEAEYELYAFNYGYAAYEQNLPVTSEEVSIGKVGLQPIYEPVAANAVCLVPAVELPADKPYYILKTQSTYLFN